MSDKSQRLKISEQQVSDATGLVRSWLSKRLKEKGYGAFVSRHEILGFLTEEYTEVVEAVHSKPTEDLQGELIDIAVGCIFGIACIEAGALDW